MNKRVQSRIRCMVAAGFIWGILATGVAAQPSYAVPPVTTATVAQSMLKGGGPDTAGLLTKTSDPHPITQQFRVRLDAEGRPVQQGARYVLIIKLSYQRDGSSGFAWYCSTFVWQRKGRHFELSNAKTNQMPPEEWDRLMGGRSDWEALNDSKTVERFDAQLDRTPAAAVEKTIRRLNAGLTGRIRVNS